MSVCTDRVIRIIILIKLMAYQWLETGDSVANFELFANVIRARAVKRMVAKRKSFFQVVDGALGCTVSGKIVAALEVEPGE